VREQTAVEADQQLLPEVEDLEAGNLEEAYPENQVA
jgi:hypothetical protein